MQLFCVFGKINNKERLLNLGWFVGCWMVLPKFGTEKNNRHTMSLQRFCLACIFVILERLFSKGDHASTYKLYWHISSHHCIIEFCYYLHNRVVSCHYCTHLFIHLWDYGLILSNRKILISCNFITDNENSRYLRLFLAQR
jgi:hypothetical protein